jgi:hypothetical protein
MSTLRVNTLQNAAGTSDPAISGAAKAWVNFNGTGTVAIRASFNVSSITDRGTGQYTVNFTNAMTDVNYCASFGGGSNNTTVTTVYENAFADRTTTAILIATVGANTGSVFDSDSVNVTINR